MQQSEPQSDNEYQQQKHQQQQDFAKNLANIAQEKNDLHAEQRNSEQIHHQKVTAPNSENRERNQNRSPFHHETGNIPQNAGYEKRDRSPIIDNLRLVDRNPIVQPHHPSTTRNQTHQQADPRYAQVLRPAQRPQVYGQNVSKQHLYEKVQTGANTRFGPATLSNVIQKSIHQEFVRQPEIPVNKGLLRLQDLEIPDQTVQKIMGPEPIPQLDIEMSEIQNELQRKMVEEITCVMCQQFPYSPLECKRCNKLFCKHCQLELNRASFGYASGRPQHQEDEFAEVDAFGRKIVNARIQNSYATGNLKNQPQKGTPGYDVCCPNCQEKGHFLQDINKVLKNCIDFCEFPHKCYIENRKNGEIIWKTLLELQEHAIYDCPKFGCDICYQEEFQHMTRAQLFNHIKRECSEVMVQCPTCSMEFVRGEYASHECLKDKFMKRLKMHQYEVVEYLAEHLMRLRRQKEGLGFCVRQECVEKFKQSNQYKAGQGMITPNANSKNQSVQCLRCKTVVQGYEDSYFCLFCNDCYCGYCQGYAKYFDLAELESIIMSENVLKFQ